MKHLFDEEELDPNAVVRNFRTTASDGKSYDVQYYNLEAILAVGFRVKSPRGTQFRKWANTHLQEHLVKGFKIDDEQRNRRQLLDTPHFSNPLYSDYNTVIDLSKRVLKNQGASFGEAKGSSAFLFDVSMLFEYFIRKLLQRAGISLLPKSDGDHKISTGALGYRRDLQPDILFDHKDQR